jgi:hypothetical protein
VDEETRRIPSWKMLLGWAAMRNVPVAMVVSLQRKTHLNPLHLLSTSNFVLFSATLATTMAAQDTNDDVQPGLLAQLARPPFVGNTASFECIDFMTNLSTCADVFQHNARS